MEKSNDKAKKVNKLNINEMKIEYKGKIYSFIDAKIRDIIVFKPLEKRMATKEDSDACDIEQTITKEGFHVLSNNISLIAGETKFTLNQNDVIQIDKYNNLTGLSYNDTELNDGTATVKNCQKNITCNDMYVGYDENNENKKYITIITNDIVKVELGNKQLFLTNRIIVDPDSGKIVGGCLCSKDNAKECPTFSCNIDGNQIDVEKADDIYVLTKDGKIDSIHVGYPANIKFNNKDIFMPNKKYGYIDITKIDNTILPDKTKHSGVNFRHHAFFGDNTDKPDVDSKYINASILNLEIGGKKFKNLPTNFDYTIYDNGNVFTKYLGDNSVYTIEPYNDNQYQVINRYFLPKEAKLSYTYLSDRTLLDYINNTNKKTSKKEPNEKNINNQSVDNNELSKCSSNKNIIEK